MTNQAYILLWISGGLITFFFIAIVVTWLFGHFNKLISQKINRELEEMLSAILHAEMEDREQVTNKLQQYVMRSTFRKEQLIDQIIQNGEAFIEKHHGQLMDLYEVVGIKELLRMRISSKREYIQALACRQVGDLKLYSMEVYICSLINSKNNNVIYNVLLSLAKLGDLNNLAYILNTNSNKMNMSFRAIIEVITEFKGSKEALFKATIESSDDYLKGVLIKASVEGQYEGLSEYYIKYLNSTNKNLQIACLRALSELNNTANEQHVIDMLENEEWEVRAAAAKSLERVGTNQSFERLVTMTSDKEWWVRRNAASALVTIPGGKEYAQHFVTGGGEDQYAREAIIAAMEV